MKVLPVCAYFVIFINNSQKNSIESM